MHTYKTRVLKAALVLASLLLACTMAAATVQNLLLPQVTATHMTSGSLSYTAYFTGQMAAPGEQENTLTASSNWVVKKLLVAQGDTVEAGQPLLELDVQSQRIQLQRLTASLQQQKNNINATDWTGGDRLVLEQQLTATQMEYDQLRASFPASGRLTAPVAGRVEELAALGTAPQGQVLARIVPADAPVVCWLADAAGANTLLMGGSLELKATASLLQEGKIVKSQCSLTLQEAEQQEGGFAFTAQLPQGITLPVGTAVQVMALAKTKPYAQLVPLACLNSLGGGQYSVMLLQEQEGMWGTVTTVKEQPVTLLASDATHAAIASDTLEKEAWLAVYASRGLVTGEKVRVIE